MNGDYEFDTTNGIIRIVVNEGDADYFLDDVYLFTLTVTDGFDFSDLVEKASQDAAVELNEKEFKDFDEEEEDNG